MPWRRSSQLCCDWSAPQWRDLPEIAIDRFHPRSSAHRPDTRARLAWDDVALHAIFRVEDRFVRGVHTEYQSPVWRDSCVELFVAPRPGSGYLNFELGCAGGLLLSHIEDPRRTPAGFARFRPVAPELGRRVGRCTSLGGRVDPERSGPIVWSAALRIPFALLETLLGHCTPRPGSTWRANLFKCADDSSHPHWASWSPIGERLDFHQPERFGELVFTRSGEANPDMAHGAQKRGRRTGPL